jgi:putative transposase
MIERTHQTLSIRSQCRLLSISRSSFYYEPQGETGMNLDLMRLIRCPAGECNAIAERGQAIPGDPVLRRSPPSRTFCECPAGQRMTWHLRHEGHRVNVKRIRRLMRLMRLMPIYQKPNTSRPAKGHMTYPCLLTGLRVERPNQVWCADITYLPMRRGFLYLVAIRCPAMVCLQTMRGMDWCTRKVLAWRISNTLEADFCVEAMNEAIHRFGPPEIMNTDQGAQFTSFAWTDRLKRVGARISLSAIACNRREGMDGWQGALHGQHLHRAPVATPEV